MVKKLTTIQLEEEDINSAKEYGINIGYYSRMAVSIAIENAKTGIKKIKKEVEK